MIIQEGSLSYIYRCHHFVEAVAEVLFVAEDILIALLAHLLAKAEIVGLN